MSDDTAATGHGSVVADVLAGALLHAAQTPVLVLRADGRLVAANARGHALLLDAGAEVTDPASALAGPREGQGLRQAVARAARTGSGVTHETQQQRDGGTRTFAWVLSPVEGSDVVSLIGVDISATTQELDDLQTRSCTDELTGLANRAGLLRTLRERAGSGAALLFCDLNGFKAVNDTYGHAAGDQVLVEVARRFVRAVRGEDQVARLGGDEFVVSAAPSATTDVDGLRKRIVGAVQQPMILPGGLVVMIGVAIGTGRLENGMDPIEALQKADAAMYQAKPSRTSIAAQVNALR